MTKGLTIKIANGSIATIAATILLSALFWFLPPALLGDDVAQVPILFMGIEVFALPIWWSRIIASVCWGIVWYILNIKCEELKIIPVRSVMVFIIGMALSATIPTMQRFDGTTIAFLLFFTAFTHIFGLYDIQNPVSEIFGITLAILISSLFVPGYIWMIGILPLGLLNFKVGSGRILMSFIVVLLLFAWMAFGICYSLGQMPLLMAWLNSLLLFSLPTFHGSIIPMAGAGLMALAVITVIVTISGISHSFDARVRLNDSFVNITFIFVVALALFFPSAMHEMLLVVILVAAILSALLFSVDKSKFVDTLFLIFIGLMIIYRVATGLPFLNIEF